MLTLLSFIKKYWGIALVIGGAILAFFFFKKSDTTVADQMKKLQAIHDEELKKINDAKEEERKVRAEASQKLVENLQIVQQQYEEQKAQLSDKKQIEVEALTKKLQNDPVELAKKLNEVTGFKIILPED